MARHISDTVITALQERGYQTTRITSPRYSEVVHVNTGFGNRWMRFWMNDDADYGLTVVHSFEREPFYPEPFEIMDDDRIVAVVVRTIHEINEAKDA